MKKYLHPLDSLFSRKENYLAACTESGKFRHLMQMSQSQRLKAELNNMHLMDKMEFTEVHGFPIIKANDSPFDVGKLKSIPFSARNSISITENVAVVFFEDDYKFASATWERLDQTTYKLREYSTLFTPDHSLYVDMPDAYNFTQIYKSRFAGAFWQNCGYNVIATASWGNADSFRYCFEGLPENSVIAICGIGIDWCRPATKLWEMGVRELISQISPSLLIVYGDEREVPGVTIPMVFIPPYVKTKFQNIQNGYKK